MKSSPQFSPRSASLALWTIPILLAASLVTSRAETEERLDKTFDATPGGQLVVDVDFGSIEVTTNSLDQVSIRVVRRVTLKSEEDEKSFLQDRPVTFEQDGDRVTVRSRAKSKWNWGRRQRTEGHYTIAVPAKFMAKLNTAGGSIDVSDLQGTLHAHTSGGSLNFTRVQGPMNGHTSGGSVRVNDCDGEIKVETSGGGINVAGGRGALNGHTSGGSVTVKSFDGPANVGTSGGSIHLEHVHGQVTGSTSGGSISASVDSLTGDIRLETSGGGVTLLVPEDAAFDLDASTSGGNARCELPVESSEKKARSRVKGQVHGGGPTVVLRSSGGSVQVKKL